MPDMQDCYDANVRIKDLPRRIDNMISALAALQNRPKHEVVREAMIEYAENHKHELMAVGQS